MTMVWWLAVFHPFWFLWIIAQIFFEYSCMPTVKYLKELLARLVLASAEFGCLRVRHWVPTI